MNHNKEVANLSNVGKALVMMQMKITETTAKVAADRTIGSNVTRF